MVSNPLKNGFIVKAHSEMDEKLKGYNGLIKTLMAPLKTEAPSVDKLNYDRLLFDFYDLLIVTPDLNTFYKSLEEHFTEDLKKWDVSLANYKAALSVLLRLTSAPEKYLDIEMKTRVSIILAAHALRVEAKKALK
jgi:hypothetical protein